MSAIPFILIEGSMALPRMRPLGRHLPAPFGRDWVYRPPGYSLRIELKALYAAVVHTFCMSEEGAAFGHAPLDRAAKFPADARAFASAQQPAVAASSQRAPGPRNALAGGASAVSGAALLAWTLPTHSH
ncbi:hypothetical protein [Paraburkholderia bryophila]|uniref:Uncharacterized protein n=1 Tax=Paraburkholderia bryophila TaxID=420952 RepID=A0A7Z0B8P9_9BURK|nr:hypothetical protein [Paraburkholderia bryophila]NYH24020.1 hypothetical protein [Paraburkholderia bryophila]